ncbi:Cytochrome oxidase biogenesis protein Cox11-CtaG,copper delivery to Cox1 [Pseudoalteromonas luteoviolacea B = ATCC 29581]|nr:Cytochrome oxidase biogenesis protein Cox11-CtaG,copper delivery to Cox1 [Pseudoalteromonas luteoviolacea B = ATCC 29581]
MHSALLKKLIIACLAMFAFAFALVPLYDVFCQVTGLNGKPSLEVAKASSRVDENRLVDVSFTTHAQQGAPFDVSAEQFKVTVKPGEVTKVAFSAANLSQQARVMQAIPSVSPGIASKYLHKMACFCFNQQPMKAGEKQDFELMFYVDTALPSEIEELTLSYTLFDITEQSQQVALEASQDEPTSMETSDE